MMKTNSYLVIVMVFGFMANGFASSEKPLAKNIELKWTTGLFTISPELLKKMDYVGSRRVLKTKLNFEEFLKLDLEKEQPVSTGLLNFDASLVLWSHDGNESEHPCTVEYTQFVAEVECHLPGEINAGSEVIFSRSAEFEVNQLYYARIEKLKELKSQVEENRATLDALYKKRNIFNRGRIDKEISMHDSKRNALEKEIDTIQGLRRTFEANINDLTTFFNKPVPNDLAIIEREYESMFAKAEAERVKAEAKRVKEEKERKEAEIDKRIQDLGLPTNSTELTKSLQNKNLNACSMVEISEGLDGRSSTVFFGRGSSNSSFQPIFSVRTSANIAIYRGYFKTSKYFAQGDYDIKEKILKSVDAGLCDPFPVVDADTNLDSMPNELVVLMAFSQVLGNCSITDEESSIDHDGSKRRDYQLGFEKVAFEYSEVVVQWRNRTDYYNYAERRMALLGPESWNGWATKIRAMQNAKKCF